MAEQTGWKGSSKWKLDTPCLVVDEDKLEQNLQAMQTHVTRFEKKLRPHAKTHKCSRIAKMQMDAGAVGICVAKVSEAEVLVRSGLKGTLITFPDLEYTWRGDEHGQVSFPAGSVRFEIGDVLELVVSHCDPTVNLFDVLCIARKDIVTEIWPIDMRGKCK